jgi:riboflavin biosynthesis pyrimidine reductase
MRQIYPDHADLPAPELAARYAYPGPAAPGSLGAGPAPGRDSRWLRANMIVSLDGAATLAGRAGGLAGQADREVFALLRALADVIVVGAGTARAERYQPVRPAELARWSWLREQHSPAPPIAVLSRRLDLDLDGPLLAGDPGSARTIVITTESAPAGRRAAAAARATVIVAGQDTVDLAAALSALGELGHRRLLTEGGPALLGQFVAAGLLDELCLTVSPLLAGPGELRIGGLPGPGAPPIPQRMTLAHVLADDGYLLCRYRRAAATAGPPPQAGPRISARS